MHTNDNVTSIFFYRKTLVLQTFAYCARPHIINKIQYSNARYLFPFICPFRSICAAIKLFAFSLHLTKKNTDDLNFAEMANAQLRYNHVNKSVSANECTPIKIFVPNAF